MAEQSAADVLFPEEKPAEEKPAEEEEPPKKKPKEEKAEPPAEPAPPPLPKQWRKKAPGGAMLWFYKDREGGRQGPFYPGQMRQWYVSGFFPASQLVAPSFKGEIPREYARLDAFYTNATEREAAFVAMEGVALWPTARAAPDAPADDERNDAGGEDRRPQWLEDSIRRQRAGIKRKMIYGPVERENYN